MFRGRYGIDELGRFLLIIAGILVVLRLFVDVHALSVIAVILLIIVYSRAVSRYYDKRSEENRKYLEYKDKFTGGGRKKNKGAGTYEYNNGDFKKTNSGKNKNDGKRVLICPYCKEKLRVPVGAGTIKINCPHCHKQFEETV